MAIGICSGCGLGRGRCVSSRVPLRRRNLGWHAIRACSCGAATYRREPGRAAAVIEADDALLADGFHTFEPDNCFRWTDGDALYPLNYSRVSRVPSDWFCTSAVRPVSRR